MRLERLSATAELVSSVAIVLTLGYLAVQTQQNTKALQANARQASLDSELGLIYMILEHPVLYTGPMLELSDRDYTETELIQIMAGEVAMLRTRENYWMQYQAGALDAATWESYRSVTIDSIRQYERSRQVWGLFKSQFDPRFADEVDSYLAN